jgi:hypothetical protein
MKFSKQLTRLGRLLTISLLAGFWAHLPMHLQAAPPPGGEETFSTPDDAIKALRAATETNDQAALAQIFGPQVHELMTGDKVQDANNEKMFAAKMAESCRPVNDGDNKITLMVGADEWPMPIPLIKTDGQWYFDTAAGKEEIINRHVGRDEIEAINVCRVYVRAQRRYARENPEGGSGTAYAQHLKSKPGQKDGLYWPASSNERKSPFGSLIAEAESEGYVVHARGTGHHPFHGYYFRVLTRQGDAAPGGAINYISNGSLTRGFALVAYPETWDQAGVMTFVVNQDGKVYQKNLGEDTPRIAGSMKEYNPDSSWTLVPVEDQ